MTYYGVENVSFPADSISRRNASGYRTDLGTMHSIVFCVVSD